MAFITILSILLYTAMSYASEKNSLSTIFVLSMQSISETGIQTIAVSQATSALELGLYLRDLRNDQTEPLMVDSNQ